MSRKSNAPRVQISPRQFIEVWQKASSLAEVAQQLRCKKGACRVRAWRYRREGVPLKEFVPVVIELPDWDELSEYAASFLPEEERKAWQEEQAAVSDDARQVRSPVSAECPPRADAASVSSSSTVPQPVNSAMKSKPTPRASPIIPEPAGPCDVCKTGRPGVHRDSCRRFVRGQSLLPCDGDGCHGLVEPCNPSYWQRRHYCSSCEENLRAG